MGRNLLSAILAGAAVLMPAGARAQSAPVTAFDRTAWLRDFAQLKAGLELGYANLAWFGSIEGGVDLPAVEARTRAALAAATNDDEARLAIRRFVEAFHDGHFSELPFLQPAAAATVAPPPPARLDPADPVSGCASLGYGATAPIVFSTPFETLPGFRLLSDGLTTVARAGVLTTSTGTRLGVLRIQNFSRLPFPAVCARAWEKLRVAGTPIDAAAIDTVGEDVWYDGFDTALTALARAGADALIVDIGNNSGGNDSGDWLARMVSARALRSSRLLMVATPTAEAYFDGEIETLREGLARRPKPPGRAALERAIAFFEAAKAALPAKPCDMSWVWRERRRWSAIGCSRMIDGGTAGGSLPGLPKGAFGDQDVAARLSHPSSIEAHFGAWTRPVYVLINGKSYSSAEMFAAVLQNNGAAKTVGVRTGGDGCGFMVDTDPLVLDHSRMRFRMPNCTRLRADGTDEVAGVAADIPILPTTGEDVRARANRLVAAIDADLGRAR